MTSPKHNPLPPEHNQEKRRRKNNRSAKPPARHDVRQRRCRGTTASARHDEPGPVAKPGNMRENTGKAQAQAARGASPVLVAALAPCLGYISLPPLHASRPCDEACPEPGAPAAEPAPRRRLSPRAETDENNRGFQRIIHRLQKM
jgi:hypothetical protein